MSYQINIWFLEKIVEMYWIKGFSDINLIYISKKQCVCKENRVVINGVRWYVKIKAKDSEEYEECFVWITLQEP